MSVLDNVKNIKVMPEEHLTDEMSRRMIVGKNHMLTIWKMKKGAHSSAHKHPEEQIFWISQGSSNSRSMESGSDCNRAIAV